MNSYISFIVVKDFSKVLKQKKKNIVYFYFVSFAKSVGIEINHK